MYLCILSGGNGNIFVCSNPNVSSFKCYGGLENLDSANCQLN